MDNCIFCKIAKGEIPCTKVYEDDFVFGFKDLHPLAPIHLLFVSKNHTTNINHMAQVDPEHIANVFKAIATYTKDSGLEQSGFRVVTNAGKDSGQTVFHTHFHLLGGTTLRGFGA